MKKIMKIVSCLASLATATITPTLSDLQSQLADCNLDGEISIGDAIWILTHLGNGGNIL